MIGGEHDAQLWLVERHDTQLCLVQVAAHLFVQVCRQAEVASYVVADTEFLYSSYYKKILAKQLEMNDKEGDSSEYLHEPR